VGKSTLKLGLLLHFKKPPKVNNCPRGENSPNPVTLGRGHLLLSVCVITTIARTLSGVNRVQKIAEQILKKFPFRTIATRVARWYVFRPKIAIRVNFGRSCSGRCWYILWTFGLFCGHLMYLVYFVVIWFFYPFGMLYQEKSGNLDWHWNTQFVNLTHFIAYQTNYVDVSKRPKSFCGLCDTIFSCQKICHKEVWYAFSYPSPKLSLLNLHYVGTTFTWISLICTYIKIR
jgi:hypothetical protein